jgi:hypothetical protein
MGRAGSDALIDWDFLNFSKPGKSKELTSWKLIPHLEIEDE